jgi:hypothetical protein
MEWYWRAVRSGQRALDAAVRTAQQSGLQIIFSRLDANQQNGTAWAYANVLRRLGRLPDGSPSHDWFCATYGNPALEQWRATARRARCCPV